MFVLGGFSNVRKHGLGHVSLAKWPKPVIGLQPNKRIGNKDAASASSGVSHSKCRMSKHLKIVYSSRFLHPQGILKSHGLGKRLPCRWPGDHTQSSRS